MERGGGNIADPQTLPLLSEVQINRGEVEEHVSIESSVKVGEGGDGRS